MLGHLKSYFSTYIIHTATTNVNKALEKYLLLRLYDLIVSLVSFFKNVINIWERMWRENFIKKIALQITSMETK